MNIVYIPSIETEEVSWLEDATTHLSDIAQNTYIHNHAHWSDDGTSFAPELELEILDTQVADIDTYTLITRSLGGVLALRGMYEGVLHPSALIWMGFPLDHQYTSSQPIDTWLKHTDVPIIIIQRIDDPLGQYDKVSEWVNRHNKKVLFVPIDEDSQGYSDLSALREIVATLNKQQTD